MRVYHSPTSRSTRVIWTLEEIGRPYDVVTLTREQKQSPAHFGRHPLGRVPVLENDEGAHLFESAAICLHLADLHPDANLIAEPGSTDRGRVYQWALFAMTHVEPVAFPWLRAHRRGEDESPHIAAFDPLGTAIGNAVTTTRAWVVGDDFTVADILLASMLRNPTGLGLLAGHPAVIDYVDRALARPACRRAEAVDR